MSKKQTITEHYKKYYPELLDYKIPSDTSSLVNGFICKMRLNGKPTSREEKVILSIDGFLKISAQMLNIKQDDERIKNAGEMYYVYTDEEGNSPILQASLFMTNENYHPERTTITIGIPLNLYDATSKDIYLLYDGVFFSFIFDGKVVNRNAPFGEKKAGEIKYDSSAFTEIGFSTQLEDLKSSREKEVINRSIAFYSSTGYNAWFGDIINFWHNGIYHMVVLYDHHHHGDRFGGGAHTAIHITTKDFVNWENYGELYTFKYPWETFGTGTMFYHGGKYYYAFGFHTSRMIPDEKTAGQLIGEYYEKNRQTKYFTYDEIFEKGLYPNGTNYLVSDDGINFTPSHKQVHWPENPSIYAGADGTLTMYAGYGGDGTWTAPHIDGPWRLADSPFPNREERAVTGCSTECPSMFEWNGYKYLIMGFTGFFRTEKNGNKFIDLAAQGRDIYDGLGVPMVANCNGRYIISGWLGGLGWGYIIQHRELVQKENGDLGIKWMPEHTPNPAELKPHCGMASVNEPAEIKIDKRKSYYLECTVNPDKNGRVGFAFKGEGTPFVFTLDSRLGKVHTNYNDGSASFPKDLPSMSEYIAGLKTPIGNFRNYPGENWHRNTHNFSIVKVDELKYEYKLKMIIYYETKSDNIVIDTEIGQGRTFITNRRYFNADTVTVFAENAAVKELKIYNM